MDYASLAALLSYNPLTGVIIWISGRQAGLRAGFIAENGSRKITVGGVRLLAHRIAWILYHGAIPDGMEVTHLNRHRDDNWIENLSIASRSAILALRRPWGASGVRGLTITKGNRVRVQRTVNGIHRSLGTFDTIAEALAVFEAAQAATRPQAAFQPAGRIAPALPA